MNYSLILRKHSTSIKITRYLSSYKGTGIQKYDEFLKQKQIDKENEKKEYNPLDYTLFGNKRKPKEDVFFYSDRVSGKGYSNYSCEIYRHRPYIWPPLRKLYKINLIIPVIGTFLCFLNHDALL